MKVEFGKLREAVSRVKATVAKAGTVEAFTRICIRNGKISSFDGMSGTITSCDLNGFEFSVPAKKLIALVDVLGGEDGTLEHKNGWLYVEAGAYSTKIPTFDVFEFPDLMPKGKTEVFCSATNLIKMLKICTPTMETDETKQKLYGLAFRDRYLYSTDGKRITRAELDSPANAGSGEPVSIAKPAVQQLIRLGQPKYLFWCDANVGALYPDVKTVLIARTVVGAFPFELVDAALAQGSEEWSYPIPARLLEVVERVRALVDDEEAQLLLRCDGMTLTVSTKPTETGHAEETLPFEIQTDFDIKVKAASFWSTLKQLKPTHIDLTDLVKGNSRMILFRGEGYNHAMALMS